MGGPPEYQQPKPDPLFQQLQAQSEADQQAALTNRAQIDTSAIMARYGTRLALAGTQGMAPLATLAAK